jgi:hypothetical protein
MTHGPLITTPYMVRATLAVALVPPFPLSLPLALVPPSPMNRTNALLFISTRA